MTNLYSKLGLLLILVIIPFSSIAQMHQLQLKTSIGEPIPFLSVSCDIRQYYIMSDANGQVLLDIKKIQSADTLVFSSIFYKERRVQFCELIKEKEFILEPIVIEIDDVVVSSTLFIEKMVQEMSAFFSKNYAKDYASSVTHLRTVECNGRYREFTGLQGIFLSTDFNQVNNKLFFDDNNALNWIPTTVMRSDPFAATSDNALTEHAIHLSSGSPIKKFSKESMNIEYNDYPYQNALVMKRALEIFSPLNSSQIKNFNYSISNSYKKGEDTIYIINFENKDKYFPKRTRIYGKGQMYYNITTKLLEKVIMENHQDQYTMFSRWNVSKLLPSATRHTIEVEYAHSKGHFFTKSVKLNVMWIDPQVDDNFYMIKVSPRRNPIKNNLKEFEYYEFDNFTILNKQKKKFIRYFVPLAYDKFCYTAPFDAESWGKVKWVGINMQRLHKDLSVDGRSLLQQAETNGLDTHFFYNLEIEQLNNRLYKAYMQAKKVRQIIYGD